MGKIELLSNVVGIDSLSVNDVYFELDKNKLTSVFYMPNIGVFINNGSATHAIQVPDGKTVELNHNTDIRRIELTFNDIIPGIIIDKNIVGLDPAIKYDNYVISLKQAYNIYYNNIIISDIISIQKEEYSLFFINENGDKVAQVSILNNKYKLVKKTSDILQLKEVND